MSPTFVDLFAGAGGLSLGLHAAGFTPLLAVENSPLAAETYFRNLIGDSSEAWLAHLARPKHEQIRGGLVVGTTASVLGRTLRRSLPSQVDLLAGGPPCQGFSLAGLRDPHDRRNELPFEFLDFVHLLRPRAVMIENVLGIGLSFSRKPDQEPALVQLGRALVQLGYLAEILYVNARHFGVAQNRPRVMVVGLRQADARRWFGRTPSREPPAEWHSARPTPSLFAPCVCTDEVPACAVLGDLNDTGYALGPDEYPSELGPALALRLSTQTASPFGRPTHLMNHVLRRHSPATEDRFRLIQKLHSHGMRGNPFEIAARYEDPGSGIEAVARWLESGTQLSAFETAGPKPSELSTFALAARIYALRSRKHSQRLINPGLPSPTVVTLPDDLVHYASPRVPTVRELARLQSFPDSFVFHGKETTGGEGRAHQVPQFSQVGNAVPPLLAKAVASRLKNLLDD